MPQLTQKILLHLSAPAALSFADIATKSATTLLAIIIARAFGAETYGTFAAVAALVAICMAITSVGFEQEFTRAASRAADRLAALIFVVLKGVLLVCAIAGLGLAMILLLGEPKTPDLELVIWLALAAVAARLVVPFRYLYLVLNRLSLVAAIQAAGTATLVTTCVLVVLLGGSVVNVAQTQAMVGFLLLAVWLCYLPPKPIGAPAERLSVLARRSTLFTLSNIAWVIYFNLDTYMIDLMRSEVETGYYAGAFRIVAINYVIGYAVVNSFSPRLFAKFASDRTEYWRELRRLFVVTGSLATILALALFLLSPFVIVLLLGQQYQEATLIGKVLSIAVLFRIVNFALQEALTTMDRQPLRVGLEFLLLTVNVLLNLYLIPKYGGLGAAVATIGAESIFLIAAVTTCFWAAANTKDANEHR